MRTVLEIQNLKCDGCQNTIKKSLDNLQFLKNIDICVEDSTVSFDTLSPDDLVVVKLQLSKLGYPVAEDANSLGKKAKSYYSCALGRFNN